MPEDTPNMERIEFHVPTPLLEEARQLAQFEGWRISELFRVFWERGFAAYSEGSNKRLINGEQRVKAKKRQQESE